jgi:Photosynthesis affected mutant 68
MTFVRTLIQCRIAPHFGFWMVRVEVQICSFPNKNTNGIIPQQTMKRQSRPTVGLMNPMAKTMIVASVAGLAVTANAFTCRQRAASLPSALLAKSKKKGFSTNSNSIVEEAVVAPTVVPTLEESESAPASLNAGQEALAKMRRERAEARNAELRRMQELRETDEQLQQTPAVIPEPVAQRMTQRMIPFVAVPFLGTLGVFGTFWYLATYQNIKFETSMVAASTIAILVISLMVG